MSPFRCSHGFLRGICVVPTCTHREISESVLRGLTVNELSYTYARVLDGGPVNLPSKKIRHIVETIRESINYHPALFRTIQQRASHLCPKHVCVICGKTDPAKFTRKRKLDGWLHGKRSVLCWDCAEIPAVLAMLRRVSITSAETQQDDDPEIES